jgi:hypothetical protein
VQQHGQLDQLGRLHPHRSEREPALRPVDLVADAGDEHDEQQERAGGEERPDSRVHRR